MTLRLLPIFFLLVSFTIPSGKSELIQWNKTRKLSWSDFKGAPPENAANAALSSSGILMSFTTDGESFHVELSCNFDQQRSWGRIKNDYILAHEQGHFDIAELYTRKLNKAIKAYRYRQGSFSKDINTIYRQTMGELQQMQDEYDNDTDHSRNIIQQKIWLTRISNSLEELRGFADY